MKNMKNKYDFLKNYKHEKEKTYLKIEENRPASFRILPFKPKDVTITFKDYNSDNHFYNAKEIIIRDMSDGKYKRMRIGKVVCRKIIDLIFYSRASDISKTTFIITKTKENKLPKYDVRIKNH